MSTRHKRKIVVRGGRNRQKRVKTFATEEAANKFAKSEGLEKYKLVNLKSGDSKSKKIRIVVE